jgi:antitoxin MazE
MTLGRHRWSRPTPMVMAVDVPERRRYFVSTMKARLVNIGNSRGVRIPKPLIEEAGLPEEVELHVRDGMIIIAAARVPRAGWAEAARRLSNADQSGLVFPSVATKFEGSEWQW